MKAKLAGTRYEFARRGDVVEAVCPWGNRLRIHAPDPRFGDRALAIPYVEFPVPPGTAEGLARFYREIMGAPARVENGAAHACVGPRQELVYRETAAPIAEYDGHHVAIYVADFAGPHRKLVERGLVFEESDPWQYRFKDMVDPASGRHLFTLEHEVRSLTHPLFGRPLVNRNPAQTQRSYTPGHDAFY
jgi:hypothetical protein